MSLSVYGPTCEPQRPTEVGSLFFALGMEQTPEPTHDGCPGGETQPGVLGGWECRCDCHRQRFPDHCDPTMDYHADPHYLCVRPPAVSS